MTGSRFSDAPLVRSVLHPSDFSEASQNAFAHALAIALRRKTELSIVHVGSVDPSGDPWTSFPSVRATLERWGLLEKHSPRSAVFEELAVRVKKVALKGRDPLPAILGYLEKDPADLMVLSTRREGLPRWLRKSVSEPLARRSGTMTLFVPEGTRGMVSMDDGRITLQRILLPIDREPDPQAALELALRTAEIAGGEPVEITTVHAGDTSTMPALQPPESPACAWKQMLRPGEPVDEILAAADEISADLIVMVTAGHQGILDALRGSTTERVLRGAPCPVLAVPTAWVTEHSHWWSGQ